MIPENLSAIGTAMANHLWQSTLFAILAAVSTLALRKNQASVRHHLWLAASLKFLVPFSLLMSLGSHLARLHGSADSQPVFYFVLQTMSQPFHPAPDSQACWLLPCCDGCRVMVAILWLAGFVTVIGLWWLRWRRVAAVIRGAVPVSHGREVEALRRAGKDCRNSEADFVAVVADFAGAGYFRDPSAAFALAGGDLPTASGCAPGGYSRP